MPKFKRVSIMGHAANIKTNTVNGKDVVNFSVPISRSTKNERGEWDDGPTSWEQIACWGYLAEKAARLNRGDVVYVEGNEWKREYKDKSGEMQETRDIRADFLCIIPKSGEGSQGFTSNTTVKDDDDDLPF